MVIFHGYVSHNQRVNPPVLVLWENISDSVAPVTAGGKPHWSPQLFPHDFSRPKRQFGCTKGVR